MPSCLSAQSHVLRDAVAAVSDIVLVEIRSFRWEYGVRVLNMFVWRLFFSIILPMFSSRLIGRLFFGKAGFLF
jgi:hypothetical protein